MLISNVAYKSPRARRGVYAFRKGGFNDQVATYAGGPAAFSTWAAYPADEAQEHFKAFGHTVKGFEPSRVHYDFVPFDFDHEDMGLVLSDAEKLLTWLEASGVHKCSRTVWVSGSKGLHVDVHASVFGERDMQGLKASLRVVIEGLGITTLDMSLYERHRLYRLPFTRHAKTGRMKAPVEVLHAGVFESTYTGPLEVPTLTASGVIELPAPETVREMRLARTVDTLGSVWDTCQRLRYIAKNPQGRERRRGAVAAALESSEQSFLDLYAAFAESPYMDKPRLDEVDRWRTEYEETGRIRAASSCAYLGCGPEQRAKCAATHPSHTMQIAPLAVIEPEDGRAWVRSALAEALESPDPVVIKAPVGLGKTHATLAAVRGAAASGRRVAIAAPTHALLDEIEAQYGEGTARVYSRDRLMESGELVCPFAEEIRACGVTGRSATGSVCSGCEEKPTCPYFTRLEAATQSNVVLLVHAHLRPKTMRLLGDFDHVIIDEQPFGQLCETKGMTKQALESFGVHAREAVKVALGKMPEPLELTPAADSHGPWAVAARATQAALAATYAAQTAEEQEKVRERREKFILAAEAMANLIDGVNPGPVDYSAEFSHKFSAAWAELDPAIRLSLRPGFEHLSVPNVLQNFCSYGMLAIGEQSKIAGQLPERSVVLDATASASMYEVMGARVVQCPPIRQTHTTVVQVYDKTSSKQALRGDAMAKREDLVARLVRAASSETALIVCPKSMAKHFTDCGADVGTFGALRGLNAYADYELQVVAAGYLVPPAAVEDALLTIGVNTLVSNLTPARRDVALRTRSGGRLVTVRAYGDDPLATDVLLHLSSSEITQSIRQRLYSGTQGKLCIILTNTPLDGIYADEVLSMQELEAWVEELEAAGEKQRVEELVASARRAKLWRQGIETPEPVQARGTAATAALEQAAASMEGEFSTAELALAAGVSTPQAARFLAKAKADGRVDARGANKNRTYVLI